jgi:lipid-binding SYLF domain-containing protein
MIRHLSLIRVFPIFVIAIIGFIGPRMATAADDTQLEQDSRAALKSLNNEGSPVVKALSEKAVGILVFPSVLKAGFAHYNTAAVSVGLQAGAQTFGYVLFFMSDKVLKDFQDSKNFQIGVGPNIVLIDAGAAKDINTLTAKADVYATIFDQNGLMAGVGLQGSKITKIK